MTSTLNPQPSTLLAALLLLACIPAAVAVQPNANTIIWNQPTPGTGWSNYSYHIWRQVPPTNTWDLLGATNGFIFRATGTIPPGTIFGVTANAQSNGVHYMSDIGIAIAPPDITFGAGTVNMTPNSPWTVPTGKVVSVTTDLRTWTARMRFGIQGTNVLVWHAEGTNNGRYLFIAVPSAPGPPPPLPFVAASTLNAQRSTLNHRQRGMANVR